MVNPIQTKVISAAIFACFMASATAQVPSLDARVSLSILERPLSQVVQELRDKSGANIVLLEGGNQVVRDLQVSDIYWRDALDYAVELAGCVVEQDKSGVLSITKPVRVGFEFIDQDINEIITAISKAAKANVIVGPEVTGTLRVRLEDVPWRAALEEIVKTRGYTVVEEQRNILRVVDLVSLEKQKVTKSYQLRYVRPKSVRVPLIKSEFIEGNDKAPTGPATQHFTVLEALRKALSSQGELDFIETQNVIIVRDTIQVHETIQEVLRRLDVEPAQVFVDLKFVSTSNIDVLNLGVDYCDSGPRVSVSGSQIPIELPFSIGNSGWEDGIIASDFGRGPVATDGGGIGSTSEFSPPMAFGISDTIFADGFDGP